MSDFVETECACGRKWLESRYVDKCAVCNKPSEPPVDRVLRDAISLHLFQKYDSQYDTSHMESTAFDTDASDIVAIIKRHLSKRESAQPDDCALVSALKYARETIRNLHENGNWDNGVYDPTGSMCEGVIMTGRYVQEAYDKIDAALATKRESGNLQGGACGGEPPAQGGNCGPIKMFNRI